MAASSVSVKNRIKEARQAAGLSQKDLAGKIGVRQHSISNMERDEHYPTRAHLAQICAVLGCQPGDLLYLEENAQGVEK